MRRLKNLAIREISILLSGPPAVPGARLLVAKHNEIPFLEREDVKSILRQVSVEVDKLKLAQKERELAAALDKEAAARRTPKRYRVYDSYESYESSAAQARRNNARQTFYAECLESARHNAGKQSDFGK